MILWARLVEHAIRAYALFTLELIDLLWGIGDLPDDRPGIPGPLDREYFALLDQEDRR